MMKQNMEAAQGHMSHGVVVEIRLTQCGTRDLDDYS
jgi:hypothetical protein